jgi:hypothetical protein
MQTETDTDQNVYADVSNCKTVACGCTGYVTVARLSKEAKELNVLIRGTNVSKQMTHDVGAIHIL